MPSRVVDQLVERMRHIQDAYYRLLLIVGPSGSGKTAALRELAAQLRAPLLNLNLELSRLLLDLTGRQRLLQLPQVLRDAVGEEAPVVLLDNTEILFDVSLQQDPLRMLQGLSRTRTVVASWNGRVEGGHLFYATPGHPEYRRYPAHELVVVGPGVTA